MLLPTGKWVRRV